MRQKAALAMANGNEITQTADLQCTTRSKRTTFLFIEDSRKVFKTTTFSEHVSSCREETGIFPLSSLCRQTGC